MLPRYAFTLHTWNAEHTVFGGEFTFIPSRRGLCGTDFGLELVWCWYAGC